ncbi:hypothetical protein Tco_0006598 [Tanacetum coccineum]
MAIPIDEDDETGYSTEVIRVEYEWTSPHCLECKLFGHNSAKCPKQVSVVDPTIGTLANDGFTEVVSRKNKGKKVANQPKNQIAGLRLHKSKSTFYRPINKHANDKKFKKNTAGNKKASTSQASGDKSTHISNSFSVLNSDKGAIFGESDPTNNVGTAHIEGDRELTYAL